ncbi:MAG: hypothetical protein ACOYW7_03895 [Nitrospirota bacterium]
MRIESTIYPRQVVSISAQNEPFVAPVETNNIGHTPPLLPVTGSRGKSTQAPFTTEAVATDTVVRSAQAEATEETGVYHPSRVIIRGDEDAFVDITEILTPEELKEAERAAALGVRKEIIEHNYHPDLSPKSLNLSIYV